MLERSTEPLREILGQVASGGPRAGDLFASDVPRSDLAHETYRLQPGDGILLPSVIAPLGGDLDDFFATVATYHEDYSPISALAHVLNKDTMPLFQRRHRKAGGDTGGDKNFRTACLGAAFGEATLASLSANGSRGAVSYNACRRTLSFVLCRAASLYDHGLQPRDLVERWMRLRILAGLQTSPAVIETVLLAYQLALPNEKEPNALNIDYRLRLGLRHLVSEGDTDGESFLGLLTGLYPAMNDVIEDLRGPFDGRMTAFTRLLDAIKASPRGTHTDEIAVAFICNRILPGSFAHTGVLGRLVDSFPAALVWYGVFAALSKAPNAHQLSFGLMAKLQRDLIEIFSFEHRPRCDISLEELEVLSRLSMQPESLRASQQRSLLVALLPGVDVYSRLNADGDAAEERARREAMDDSRVRVSSLLEEALYVLRNGDPPRHAPHRRHKKDR